MIVLDASVIIAALNPRDSHHDRASALLREHANEGFEMHSLTIAETLVGPVRHNLGARVMNDLRDMNIRIAPTDDREPLALAELRTETGLRMPDCCVLVAAMRGADGVATFDAGLATAAEKLGVAVFS